MFNPFTAMYLERYGKCGWYISYVEKIICPVTHWIDDAPATKVVNPGEVFICDGHKYAIVRLDTASGHDNLDNGCSIYSLIDMQK
jgi:hypothetical protein